MSGTRDADVVAETVDLLAERFVGHVPEAFFTRIKAPLAAAARGLARGHRSARARRGAARARHGGLDRSKALDEDALDRARCRRTYAEGRKAFARADAEPSADNLHEWRKRVKDLWYQQQLLEDSWPGVMKAQAKEAKKLSKLLGDDHDLTVLAEHVDDPELHALIDTRRAGAARGGPRARAAASTPSARRRSRAAPAATWTWRRHDQAHRQGGRAQVRPRAAART